ncbi:19263_t:CDS:1, partial [Gigaspora margarita]
KKFQFSDKIKNVDDVYAFKHFVKKLYPNVGDFGEFNTRSSKDNSIQYSLTITSETFLNSQYNFANCLRQGMTYNNINILFILIKNHEHKFYMEELLGDGDVIITIDPINDLLFRYQSNKFQEFTSILQECNPRNILKVCEKDRIVTIYNKESLNKPNVKGQKRKDISSNISKYTKRTKISEILKGTGTFNDP